MNVGLKIFTSAGKRSEGCSEDDEEEERVELPDLVEGLGIAGEKEVDAGALERSALRPVLGF